MHSHSACRRHEVLAQHFARVYGYDLFLGMEIYAAVLGRTIQLNLRFSDLDARHPKIIIPLKIHPEFG